MASIGQKKTQQRAVIKKAIQSSQGPVTVNEIHDKAQMELPTLGIATVYRTLSLLLEADEIKKQVFSDGQVRYEESDRKHHHHHFLCRVCDKSFCLDICPVKNIQPDSLPQNFTVENHELILHGTCDQCT